MRLLLASASSTRVNVLRAAGVDPMVMVSGVDEDQVLADAHSRYGTLSPADAVLVLARAKCEAVVTKLEAEDELSPDVVLGCGSLLELDGCGYGKPADVDEARARWRLMAGRTALLHTGHWLVDMRAEECSNATFGQTVTTEVTFSSVSERELEAYLASGEPLGCAGAFTIDGLGGAFVTSLRGDHLNVLGLSLPTVRSMLGEIGISWTEFWTLPLSE